MDRMYFLQAMDVVAREANRDRSNDHESYDCDSEQTVQAVQGQAEGHAWLRDLVSRAIGWLTFARLGQVRRRPA